MGVVDDRQGSTIDAVKAGAGVSGDVFQDFDEKEEALAAT